MQEITALDKLYPAPKDGNDAVVYSIVCSNTNPNVTDSDVSVTLTAYRTVGTVREMCEFDKNLYLGNFRSAKLLFENPATVVIPKGDTGKVPILLIGVNGQLAACTISPVVNGETGGVGPMMYYAGEWQTGVSYVRTAQVVPLVSHGSDQFFYYPAKEGTLLNNEPSSSNTAWKQQQKVPLLLAQLLMVDFGKIASAVFSGDYMMSQYGLDGNNNESTDYKSFDGDPTPYIGNAFAPNICLDFLKGEAWLRKAHISGVIDAGSINIEYTKLSESDATKVSDLEYTLNNDLNILIDVGAINKNVVINLPTDKSYIGKHVYLMSHAAPWTRVGFPSFQIACKNRIYASSDRTNILGYKSLTFVSGIIHLMAIPYFAIAEGCLWGVMSCAASGVSYES